MGFSSAKAVERRLREILADRGITHTPFTVHQSSAKIVWVTWFDTAGQTQRVKVCDGMIYNATVGYLDESDLENTADRLIVAWA